MTGSMLTIVTRSYPGSPAELVARKPELIFAPSPVAALAAKQATRTIPIVFGIHSVAHIREGLLEAPFGREGRLDWGSYLIVVSTRSSARPIFKAFVAWLHDEARMDAIARR
jgi:hypothetical protein